MSLGTAKARNVGDVRKAAEQLYHRVKLGEDPAGDRAQAVAAAAQTFEAAANEYLEQAREWLRKSTYPDVKRYLLKHCKPLHQLSRTHLQ